MRVEWQEGGTGCLGASGADQNFNFAKKKNRGAYPPAQTLLRIDIDHIYVCTCIHSYIDICA